jgi:hypothetical protein
MITEIDISKIKANIYTPYKGQNTTISLETSNVDFLLMI